MGEINTLQTNIMFFVRDWANHQKTPIPQKAIVTHLETQGIKDYISLNAIRTLVNKGFIRKAYSEKGNTTLYVMIRNI